MHFLQTGGMQDLAKSGVGNKWKILKTWKSLQFTCKNTVVRLINFHLYGWLCLVMTIDDLARGLELTLSFLTFPKHSIRCSINASSSSSNTVEQANLLRWIEDFLSARTQEVVIHGTKSTPTPITSGVPQGTMPGPLLFLAYINNMPARVLSTIKRFSDDSLHKPERCAFRNGASEGYSGPSGLLL